MNHSIAIKRMILAKGAIDWVFSVAQIHTLQIFRNLPNYFKSGRYDFLEVGPPRPIHVGMVSWKAGNFALADHRFLHCWCAREDFAPIHQACMSPAT